ncbi:MAG TPA: PAS domain S-box protein [Mucilaginibacter sp.]|jgi:PAS domain S-box-containing protein|nr:PAS domain S-box protein [Mucilaginibacter sp.]
MPDLSVSNLNECTIAFDGALEQVVFTSPNTENILGYAPSCFYSDPKLLFNLADSEMKQKLTGAIDGLTDGQQVELVYPITTPKGEKLWVRDRKSIAGNEQTGQKILLSVFSKYQHGATPADNDALVREQFLNSLIDSQTNFLIRFDTQGCFTFANKQFLKKLGYKKSEVTGKHFSLVTIPDEMEMCTKAFIYCVKHPGKVIPLAHKKRDKWGNLFDTEWEFISVTNDDGEVVAIQGIGRDKTEASQAQEEIVWTKSNLEALINNTEDQIWSVDKEMRYVYMNKAYRSQITRLTGIEPKKGDHPGMNAGFTVEQIDLWNGYYQRALAGERYVIINESIEPETNMLLSFEISFNPIYRVKGDITGVGCFGRNITEWLETEKAVVDQNERLRHIASLTSHELRRPVASMLGLINIMDRANFFNPDNQEIIGHLLTVGNEIDAVIRLIVDKTIVGDQSKDKYQSP